jgi:hypothetical protein
VAAEFNCERVPEIAWWRSNAANEGTVSRKPSNRDMAQILEGFINDTIGIGVISGRIVTSLIASRPNPALPPK